jgi:hypothetical protein
VRSQRGQATVEWVGLMLLALLVVAAVLVTVGWRTVRVSLRDAVLQNLICAVRLTEDCREEPALRDGYGHELAALVRANAPALLYGDGMTAMPVDYRRCRIDQCAAGAGEGTVLRTERGERAVAFTHLIDCRSLGVPAPGADCSGERGGNLYLQYWFYYPGSATGEGSTPLKGVIRKASSAVGTPSYHRDDWESFQVRIEPGGRRFARASSHHGYGPGWVPGKDRIYVAGGSHAGRAEARDVGRATKDDRLVLIPLAQIARTDTTPFAVTPPWRKRVYRDPEYGGTD